MTEGSAVFPSSRFNRFKAKTGGQTTPTSNDLINSTGIFTPRVKVS